MSLKKEIAKSNVFFTIGRVVSAIIAFFFSIILARLLQPYNFGLYSFTLVVVTLFTIFTDLGMNSTLTRFTADYFSKKEYGKIKSLMKLILKYKVILVFFVGICISLFSKEITTYVFNKPEAGFVVFFSGFLLISNSLFSFLYYFFSGLKNFKFVSALQISESAFKFVFVITFVVLGMAVTGALSGLIITYIILVVISSMVIYKKYNFIFSEDRTRIDKRILLTFGIWAFVGSIVGTIYGLVDQLMISIMLPVESVGFYRIGVTWMFSVMYIVPIAGYVLGPYFSSASSKSQLNLMFFNSIRYSAIFIFPLAFLLSTFSKPLIVFFYKESFIVAYQSLEILAFASIPILISEMLTSFFTGIKKPQIVAKILFVMICLNIILNYFLIQLYGIRGAAIATLVAISLYTLILLSIAIFAEKLMFKSSAILKPLIASIIMYLAAGIFLPSVTNYFTLFLYGFLSLLIYLIIMLIIGGVKKEDLLLLKSGLRL